MKILQLILAIMISQSAGLIGSFFTRSAIPVWYAGLNKPAFNPPNWIFAPVWTTLYALMGIASYFIWQKRGSSPLVTPALVLFGIHLALNTLWSVLFFGLKNPGAAFIEIIILWLMILALIVIFYKIDHKAAWLLVPYFLWVSFASVLNYSIWRLN